jgi:metal-dependent amidase/aminoacylase/carboxypeptidase family protein
MYHYTCLNFDVPHNVSPTVLFPHTAEESGAGKQILLEKGAYKDMNVCIMYVL